jgi:putative holliday junction resolvase
MKFLGIDPGKKYFGLALGEEDIKMAFPYQVLEFTKTKDLINNLKDILNKEKIDKIIIGRPLNFQGKPTMITKDLDEIIKQLEKEITIPLVRFDERLTSKMAGRLLIGQKKNHAVAAQIILQNYLESFK